MSSSKNQGRVVFMSLGIFCLAICAAGCGGGASSGGTGGKGSGGSATGGNGSGGAGTGGSGTGGSGSGGSASGGSGSGGSGTGGSATGGSGTGGSSSGGATAAGGAGGNGGGTAGAAGGRGGGTGGGAAGGRGGGNGTGGAGGGVVGAVATLDPIVPGTIAGTAVFTQVANGVQVVVNLQNCPAGAHPIHIHEGSSCTSTTTQGMHWGGTGGPGEDIGPNGGEITCGAGMTGTLTYTRMNTPAAKGWTIGPPAATNVIGHVMVVHSSTVATDRHACGVINMAIN